MLDRALLASTFLSGLIGGVFFAFSTFVMRALARRPAAEGMAAMQAINVVVLNPMFLGAFMGTAVTSAIAAVAAVVLWGPSSVCVLAGAALYVLGTFGVTVAFNVPLNNALAAVEPTDPRAADVWADYVKRWTRWNHVRTIAAVVAMAAFVVAMWR